jgi:hypothetical protein
MKQLKIQASFFTLIILGLASCKKGAMNIDTESGSTTNVVEFANTGENLSSATVSKYPGFYTDLGSLAAGASAKFNVNVSYSGKDVAPQDVTVNLALDTAALALYNKQNGTGYTAPPAAICTYPTTVVIKKGTHQSTIEATITNNSSFNFSVNYALPLKIAASSYGVISSNFGSAVYAFGVRNIYDGHYSLKGYTLRGGDPAKTGNFVYPAGMNLATVGGNIVQFGALQVWTDLTGVGIGYPVFTINADNTVTVASSGGAYNAPGYTSRYVPAEKTFYVSFSWGAGPSSRLATDTLTYVGPR